ncbi:hypothetical protein CBR_g736 [Chara braunii]|uniref:Uncharacterized protein n=1 Tax=Chara braunii TaxID=69332 RepID=A0A388KC76_CHABU|nr:hypothetical protein CBR_g736 [Chara braunii]|eukprot:GBG67606.1 hypothetical protein CBR_g736 [Chara braunii]
MAAAGQPDPVKEEDEFGPDETHGRGGGGLNGSATLAKRDSRKLSTISVLSEVLPDNLVAGTTNLGMAKETEDARPPTPPPISKSGWGVETAEMAATTFNFGLDKDASAVVARPGGRRASVLTEGYVFT